MVKSFKYIIKRIIIGVGIAIALMLIKGNLLIGVKADSISLGTPTTGGYYSGGSWTATTAPVNQSGYYSSYNINEHPTTGGVYFEWSNANLCAGKNLTISGTAQVYRSSLVNLSVTGVKGYFNSWASEKQCTFSQNGNDINFSCTGPGGGGLVLYYLYDNVYGSSGQTLTINTPISVNVTCDASTNDIINNQTENTNNIINNNNQNTQTIINNQNENTEKEIESQKVCNSIIKNKDNTNVSDGYLQIDGSINTNYSAYSYTTDFIDISNSTNISLNNLQGSNPSYCLYNSSHELISCTSYNGNSFLSISINSDVKFIRFSIRKDLNSSLVFYQCKNGNQAIADTQQDINNSLNDTTGVSDNDINDLFSEFEESNTPISDLLLMPITLYTAFISGISATCAPVSLGALYGTPINLPCINLEDILGSTLWSLLDLLFSFFMFYNISQLIITAFNNLTSLKDDFNLLFAKHYNQEYQGRHAG